MQLCLTATVVVFIILEVTSGSVSSKCEVDDIIAENGLTPNNLKTYKKQISQSSYQAVFNINGENKTLTAGKTRLVLVTNKTEPKWTTFFYSDVLFRFIIGSPMKVMMYDQDGNNYKEQYLGNKRISPTACQNIDCKPYISIPANSYIKQESFQQHDCEKYTLFSVTFVPGFEPPLETFDDNSLPFNNTK